MWNKTLTMFAVALYLARDLPDRTFCGAFSPSRINDISTLPTDQDQTTCLDVFFNVTRSLTAWYFVPRVRTFNLHVIGSLECGTSAALAVFVLSASGESRECYLGNVTEMNDEKRQCKFLCGCKEPCADKVILLFKYLGRTTQKWELCEVFMSFT